MASEFALLGQPIKTGHDFPAKNGAGRLQWGCAREDTELKTAAAGVCYRTLVNELLPEPGRGWWGAMERDTLVVRQLFKTI